jgi:uncharacterized glyoxalase superfamily metalloenzyme YdcJ
VVSFKGPHINHLTPRTLDIDAVQVGMPKHNIVAKAVIEGPPTRACPILLRQTSFKALEESIVFKDASDSQPGTHTARFGEIEQRGLALARKGRQLYDELLGLVRSNAGANDTAEYTTRLAAAFERFPDNYDEIRRQNLGFFRYSVIQSGAALSGLDELTMEEPIARGHVRADPIVKIFCRSAPRESSSQTSAIPTEGAIRPIPTVHERLGEMVSATFL